MLSKFMTEGLFIKALNVSLENIFTLHSVENFTNNNHVLVLLQSYLSAFSFSNAVQDDLWNHIQKVIKFIMHLLDF